MAVHDQAIPVGDLHPADLRLTWIVWVPRAAGVLIAVLLDASTNLFAVSPVIIGDLLLSILALIAKWFLGISIGSSSSGFSRLE